MWWGPRPTWQSLVRFCSASVLLIARSRLINVVSVLVLLLATMTGMLLLFVVPAECTLVSITLSTLLTWVILFKIIFECTVLCAPWLTIRAGVEGLIRGRCVVVVESEWVLSVRFGVTMLFIKALRVLTILTPAAAFRLTMT